MNCSKCMSNGPSVNFDINLNTRKHLQRIPWAHGMWVSVDERQLRTTGREMTSGSIFNSLFARIQLCNKPPTDFVGMICWAVNVMRAKLLRYVACVNTTCQHLDASKTPILD